MSWHLYLPVALFWIAVASMLGTITYQSLKIELSPSYAKVVLLEIALTCLVFHLIYVIPYYGLSGYDPYADMVSAKGILSSGFVLSDPKYINLTSNFPMIQILGAILSMITSIDLFSVAKWFPPLVDVVVIPLLYLLVRSIFKDEKVALLSALLFACLQNHISFSSGFIRETLGLVLAVCCVYLYFSAKHSPHPATNYALSIMCLIATVIAHHLTSFMLLIFLSIHFLVTRASEAPFLRRTYFGGKIMGEKVTTTFISIASVALFAHWIFAAIYPLRTLTTLVTELFIPGRFGGGSYAELTNISAFSIRTIRGYIIFYGFYFFLLIFGLILLYRLSPRAKNRRVETYSFSLFLFFCGLIGFLSLYVLPVAAFPDRFLTYGWLFGFVPLVAAILKGKYKWPRRIGVLLLVAFMLFNIYMIATPYWNARTDEIPVTPSLEDYTLVYTFNFSTGKIIAPYRNSLAIYDVHNNLTTVFTYSEEVNLANFDWVIIQKQELELQKSYYLEPTTETIALLEHLAFESSVGYNKIYESNNLVVVKPTGS